MSQHSNSVPRKTSLQPHLFQKPRRWFFLSLNESATHIHTYFPLYTHRDTSLEQQYNGMPGRRAGREKKRNGKHGCTLLCPARVQRAKLLVGSFGRPILCSESRPPSRSRAGLISAPAASPPPCLPPRSTRTARALASLDAAGTTWPQQLMGGGNGASRAGIIVGSTQLFIVGVGRVWRGRARARKPNAQYLAQVRFQPAPSDSERPGR